MSDALSQDEIDALLKGVSDGDVPVEEETAAPETPEAKIYDLCGQERVLAGRELRSLQMIYERFLRRLRPSLSSLVGAPPVLDAGPLEMVKFSSLVARLVPGTTLHLFSMAPLRGQGLLAISGGLGFSIVDRVFGGSGVAPNEIPSREQSPVEANVLQSFIKRTLEELGQAWSLFHRIECAYVRTEMNPASVGLGGGSDTIIVVELGCDVGGGSAPILLAIPYAVIEPIRTKLGEQDVALGGTDPEWVEAMTETVCETDLTIAGELGAREISARELFHLRVGDVLTLPTKGDDPVWLRIEETIPLMKGLAGVSRGNNAVRILSLGSGD